MAEISRLNGVISALEQGKPAFVSFMAAEIGAAQAINAASGFDRLWNEFARDRITASSVWEIRK